MTKEQRDFLKVAARIIQQRDETKKLLAQREAEVDNAVRIYGQQHNIWCVDERMLRNACSVFMLEAA